MEITLRDIYEQIENNNGIFDSVELANIFNTDPSTIRNLVMEINKATTTFKYGIISKGNKYFIATELSDIDKKVGYYKRQYKHISKMISLWEARAIDIRIAKGQAIETELEPWDYDTIDEAMLECPYETDYQLQEQWLETKLIKERDNNEN